MTAEVQVAVMTVARVKPGRIEDVAGLFRDTNPALVADQPAWRSARLLADRDTNTVTVIAVWSDPDAYRRFAAGPLRDAMQAYAPLLEGPPEVTIHEIMVDM